MRIISVTLLLTAVALAGCQGGQRLSKAANVDQPAVGQPDVASGGVVPTGDSICMEKCMAKANDKLAKCMATSAGAEACNAAQVEDLLACRSDCTP